MVLRVEKDVVIGGNGPIIALYHTFKGIDLGAKGIHSRNYLVGVSVSLLLRRLDCLGCIVNLDKLARCLCGLIGTGDDDLKYAFG